MWWWRSLLHPTPRGKRHRRTERQSRRATLSRHPRPGSSLRRPRGRGGLAAREKSYFFESTLYVTDESLQDVLNREIPAPALEQLREMLKTDPSGEKSERRAAHRNVRGRLSALCRPHAGASLPAEASDPFSARPHALLRASSHRSRELVSGTALHAAARRAQRRHADLRAGRTPDPHRGETPEGRRRHRTARRDLRRNGRGNSGAHQPSATALSRREP